MLRLAQAAALALACFACVPAAAQNAAPPAVPFLTVDQERLFTDSLWGQRVVKEIEEASEALQAENRKIEAALTAEEKSLTDQRPTLAPEEFRKLADDFDSRVTGIRKAQDDKARSIADQRDRERQAFFEAALPIMGEVMSERGAVAILDNRAIFLSVKAIDATDAVLARLNEKLGPGPAAPQPD